MPEGLRLEVGADVSQATKALQELTKDAAQAGNTISKGLGQSLAPVATNITKVQNATIALNNSLKQVRPGANAATQSLINVGRVAQDLPFGIIGIANNLNPLLESFQRTAKEAGGFGGAMKALGASLLGGGGLGLALSLVTGAMSFFALNNRSSKKDVDAHKESVDKIAEAKKKFADAVDKASSAVLSEAKNIADLRDLLISTDSEVRSLTQSTINLGLAQFLFDKKNVEVQKLLSAEIKKQLALRQQNNPFAQIDQTGDLKSRTQRAVDFFKKFGVNATKAQLDLQEFSQEAKIANQNISGINQLSDGFEGLFKKIIDGKQKVGKEIVPTLPNIRTAIATVQEVTVPFRFDPGQFDVRPMTGEQEDRINALVAETFKGFVIPVTLDTKNVDAEAIKLAQRVQDILTSGFANLGASIGETFGDAISGETSGFGAIIKVLGSLIEQIGKALIQYGIVKAGLDKILGPAGIAIPGAVAIGLGIAAVAAAQAFKNIKGFAAGGLVSGPTLGLIGEGIGTSRSNPEVIAPLDQLKAMLADVGSGGQQVVVLRTQIRGDNLALVQARTSKSQRRRGAR